MTTKTTESSTLPFLSLNGVSSAVAGDAKDLRDVLNRHTVVFVAAGSGSWSANALLEGSLDDVNWFPLVTVNMSAGATNNVEVRSVSEHAVRFVRARTTYVASGTTLSATIASQA